MPLLTRQELKNRLSAMGTLCVNPVPEARNQWGPCCGFYALSIAMKVVALHDARLATPPARKRDDPNYAGRSLRSYGKHGRLDISDISDKGPSGIERATWAKPDVSKPANDADAFTELGEIFDVAQLVKLARHLNYGAKAFDVKNGKMYEVIEKLIKADCLALVPFDVNDQGDPDRFQGDKAHYGLVFGCCTDPSDPFLKCYFATHMGQYFWWPANDLQASCDQLMTAHAEHYIKVFWKKAERRRWEWMSTATHRRLCEVTKQVFQTGRGHGMKDADLTGLRSKLVGIGLSSTAILAG